MNKITAEERKSRIESDKAIISEAINKVRNISSDLTLEISNENIVNERGIKYTGVRIVYGVAGEDGELPLYDYIAPYIKMMSMGEYAGGVTGDEYRLIDDSGNIVAGDYLLSLNCGAVDSSIISWLFAPTYDEIKKITSIETLLDDSGNEILDNGGSTIQICKDYVNAVSVSPVMDTILSTMKDLGLVYAYWKSLDELVLDTSSEALEVKSAWNKSWINEDGSLKMLEIG